MPKIQTACSTTDDMAYYFNKAIEALWQDGDAVSVTEMGIDEGACSMAKLKQMAIVKLELSDAETDAAIESAATVYNKHAYFDLPTLDLNSQIERYVVDMVELNVINGRANK